VLNGVTPALGVGRMKLVQPPSILHHHTTSQQSQQQYQQLLNTDQVK